MGRTIAVICAVFGAFAISTRADSFLIRKGSAGRVRVGMTVEDVYLAYKTEQVKLVDLRLEGMFSPALQILAEGTPPLTAEIDKDHRGWVISRITVRDARFQTAGGIRVGSTLADLKKAYPALKLSIGDGGRHFARADNESLAFELDASLPKHPSGGSRVISIVVSR